jgi:Fe-S-cluster-containing dehydrogenase component
LEVQPLKKLIFNPEKCTGCRACELACSFSCEGLFVPNKSRIKAARIDEEGMDIPMGCFHCDQAPCMLLCPVRAIYFDKDMGGVLINHDKCIGCRLCMTACPFGAISYDSERRLVYKCDLCGGDPECVKWCFTQALTYEEAETLAKDKRSKKVESTVAALTAAARLVVPGRG